MRRDYVTLDVRRDERDGDRSPGLVLTFDGPAELLEERLVDVDGDPLSADQLDVAFRLQTPLEDDEAAGVLSLTERVTGDFVLEVNADAEDLLAFVDAVRDGDGSEDGDGRYRVEIRQDDRERAAYEKRTLLVYDSEGSLLRQHSLIPSGVEL